MKNSTSVRVGSSGWFLIAPLAVIASGVVVVGASLYDPPRLSAAPSITSPDSDGDGLIDRQEAILGSSSGRVDTDRDGFSDTEELARKTSPIFDQWRPTVNRVSVGMSAHGAGGKVHVMLAVYCKVAEFQSLRITLGAQIGGRLVNLTDSRWLDGADVHVVPAADPRSMVALLDLPLGPQWIQRMGDVTFFATVAGHGSSVATSADTAELLYLDGMNVLVQDNPTFTINSTSGASGGHTQANGGSGSVFRPLPLDDEEEVPSSWTEDQICAQRSSPVGVSGAVVTQEVVSAECQEGWDSSCPPSCSSSVGSTHTTIDPMVLIGG